MNKQAITFRIDKQKKKALDAIALDTKRDRSYVLNEAVENYLDLNMWQIEHIKKGLRQAESGHFAKESEVSLALAKWRK